MTTNEHIVVLSPGLPDENDVFPEYIDDVYIGGDVRMRAARQLVSDHPETMFIAVGGFEPDELVFGSQKTSAMRRAMCEDDTEAWQHIQDMPSLPCTQHNLIVCCNELQGQTSEFTILTNEYHIPRTIAFAARAVKAVFASHNRPRINYLSAEKVLRLDITERLRQDQRYAEAYKKRLELETRGLRALQEGNYSDSCFRRHRALLSRLALRSWGRTLFAPQELELFEPEELQAAREEIQKLASRKSA